MDSPHGESAECGWLLVGHGSREALGVQEFLATAQRVAQAAGNVPQAACFLEFAQPTIAEGVSKLVRRGVERIVVVPVMLFAAAHVKRDIPAAVAQAAQGFGHLAIEMAEPLGCHESILELSRVRYEQAVCGRLDLPADETALVMVGRGSLDTEATREMFLFAALRGRMTPAAHVRTGFMSMTEPTLAHVLDEVVRLDVERIVVQPHFLFGGVLVDRIARMVETFARKRAGLEWITASYLGPTGELVQAIAERAKDSARQFA